MKIQSALFLAMGIAMFSSAPAGADDREALASRHAEDDKRIVEIYAAELFTSESPALTCRRQDRESLLREAARSLEKIGTVKLVKTSKNVDNATLSQAIQKAKVLLKKIPTNLSPLFEKIKKQEDISVTEQATLNNFLSTEGKALTEILDFRSSFDYYYGRPVNRTTVYLKVPGQTIFNIALSDLFSDIELLPRKSSEDVESYAQYFKIHTGFLSQGAKSSLVSGVSRQFTSPLCKTIYAIERQHAIRGEKRVLATIAESTDSSAQRPAETPALVATDDPPADSGAAAEPLKTQ